jgi:hypothetical protein
MLGMVDDYAKPENASRYFFQSSDIALLPSGGLSKTHFPVHCKMNESVMQFMNVKEILTTKQICPSMLRSND